MDEPSPRPAPGAYTGHEGVRSFFHTLFSLFEGVRIDADEFIPVGDEYVLAFVRIWARGKGTRVETPIFFAISSMSSQPMSMTSWATRC